MGFFLNLTSTSLHRALHVHPSAILIWAAKWQNQQNDCVPSEDFRSAWASAQSDQSLSCALNGQLRTQAFFMRTSKTDQTGRMPRLIWVFAGQTCHIVSSPEPSGSQGELIVYPYSGVRCRRCLHRRRRRRRQQCLNIFSSETALPIKAKFYVEPPWEGGTKVYINGPGHMTKVATMPIYGKNL